jgi:hypothetical protein
MLWQEKIRTHQIVLISLLIYASIRIFSYFFAPGETINTLVSSILLIATAYLIAKKNNAGWLLVIGEWLLGGSGNFLSLATLSLRTSFVVISLSIFIWQERGRLLNIFKTYQLFTLSLAALALVVLNGIAQGFRAEHPLSLIIADSIPYLSLGYFFPLALLLRTEKNLAIIKQILLAACIGNALFILGTLIAFSTGSATIHASYYRWFRDVVGGKITDLHNNFFRIVVNEHVVLVPLLLTFLFTQISTSTSFIVKKIQGLHYYVSLGSLLSIAILACNLTRIYFLGLGAGLLALVSRRYFKRWFAVSIIHVSLLIGLFSGFHLAASRGTSLGLELLGIRLKSIASPAIEESSLSRLLLLPKITSLIHEHPLLGNGLGASVTVYSPVTKQTIVTPQFDWGFLEIIAELGLLGFFAWCFFGGLLFIELLRSKRYGLLAGTIAILVETITSPAAFHTLGIIWFVSAYALVMSTKILPENRNTPNNQSVSVTEPS